MLSNSMVSHQLNSPGAPLRSIRSQAATEVGVEHVDSPPPWELARSAPREVSLNAAHINEQLTTVGPPTWVSSPSEESEDEVETDFCDPLGVQITPAQLNWYLTNAPVLGEEEGSDQGEAQSPSPSALATYRI